MAVISHDDVVARAQARPTIDVTKIIVWIAAAALPWAAVILTAKAIIAALA